MKNLIYNLMKQVKTFENFETPIFLTEINSELEDVIVDIEDRFNVPSSINVFSLFTSRKFELIFRTNINSVLIKDVIIRIMEILNLHDLEIVKYDIRFNDNKQVTYDRYRDFKDYVIDGNKKINHIILELDLKK